MSKITTDHLVRSAYVYIRQSTPDQLAHNHESRRRQYDLADRARQLGWTTVEVIDDDLGRSGGGTARPGFERLLAAICEARVGAVLAIEASRLARNGRDWHTLVEFCGLVGTLIVDEDGIYDPRHPNDRLLLIQRSEPRAWRNRRGYHLLLDGDPRGDLAPASPIRPRLTLRRLGAVVHPARPDPRTLRQLLQMRDLRPQVGGNMLQRRDFAKQLQNQGFQLGTAQPGKRRWRWHIPVENPPHRAAASKISGVAHTFADVTLERHNALISADAQSHEPGTVTRAVAARAARAALARKGDPLFRQVGLDDDG